MNVPIAVDPVSVPRIFPVPSQRILPVSERILPESLSSRILPVPSSISEDSEILPELLVSTSAQTIAGEMI